MLKGSEGETGGLLQKPSALPSPPGCLLVGAATFLSSSGSDLCVFLGPSD